MRRIILPALSALALAACQESAPVNTPDPSSDDTPPAASQSGETPTMPVTTSDIETARLLADGNNTFAWSVYDALEAKPGNVFVSPASISGAFGLLYPGSAGNTQAQIADLFGFDAVPADAFPAAAYLLSEEIGTDTDKAKLTVANAVWLRQGSALQAPYRVAVQDIMKAKVELVDFTQPAAAAGLINDWVKAKTNDRIKDLIPASAIKPQLTELILTNAVWFKADWKSPFKAEATEDAPFYAPSGERTAKMMRQTLKKARYIDGDGYAALDLDYVGDDYALTVILPDARDGLSDVAAAMTPDSFAGLIDDIETAATKRVNVFLPKVKVEADYQLNDVLIGLGLTDGFSASADFSRLIEGAGPGDLVISQVLHKTFLEIDEKGTEAAAATAIIMERSAIEIPQEEPIEFRADHPYLIALRHRPTGAVVFMGRIEEPSTD